MQIRNKRKFSKKSILVTGSIVSILIIACIITGIYLYKLHGNLFGWQPNPLPQNSSINYKAPTAEQKTAGSTTKQQSLSNQTKGTSGTDQPPAPMTQPSGQSSVQMTITAANQTASVLQVRTQIDIVADSGTCTLTLTKAGSATITQTAGIQSFASISTCKGFDIPLSQLSSGIWNIALHFSGNNTIGDTSRTITIH
jgi:cytoskeletal protein RodZ